MRDLRYQPPKSPKLIEGVETRRRNLEGFSKGETASSGFNPNLTAVDRANIQR